MQQTSAAQKKHRTRSSRNSWPHIYKRTHPSGQVSWIVDLGEQNRKRIRKAFSNSDDAELYAENARVDRRQQGQAAFNLSDKVRHQAAECVKLLQPYNVNIVEACTYYVDHVLKFRAAPSVREIVKLLIDQKRNNKRRADTIEELHYRLGNFVETFGERKLADISQEELEQWFIRPNWSTQTRDHYMTKIGMVYNFAMKRKDPWVDRNLIKYIERPIVENKPAEVFTVNETAKLLTRADEFGLLPYCVLGLFCGVRPREINRLTWDKVKLSERSVIVEGLGSKTRARRVVPLNDTALAWLSTCARQSGAIMGLKKNTLNRRQKNLAALIGLPRWKQDGLRHSFGTYLLSISNDENMVAHQMGNSPTMVHRHYKALVTEAEAQRFWALRPTQATNIVPISARA